MSDRLLDLATQIVEKARARGAPIAEAVATQSRELSAKVRLGRTELVEEAASLSVGLRIIDDARSGTAYTSDTSASGIEALVDDGLELARLSEPDPFSVPPEPDLLAKAQPELDLFDAEVEAIDATQAIELARRTEAAARAFDPRISNSEGASFTRSIGGYALVTSGGFSGSYRGTSCGLSMEPVAEDRDGKKQRGSYWDSRRYFRDLASAEEIGREAARRTVSKLGARNVPTARVPVVFQPDAARALLSLLLSSVYGSAIYRRASYLCDREGTEVASPLVEIVDDPLIRRGTGSRPFDGEGLPSRKNVVVERGVLRTYLLDCYSARKLGRASTGNASRGAGSAPTVSATNLVLLPGDRPPEAIIREVDRGLFVSSMMGFGFNAVTGDFSRGAEGFWIEGGELGQAVSEVTVSLGFNDLWRRIDAIGNDLDTRSRLATPTLRVSEMTVAGR
ncbi:MAG: TldD/PmbA family protein [Deltaproteobacteria bacterium]|nr:TldD/PmbA family protein [Deltaproteobacteria bacterium]